MQKKSIKFQKMQGAGNDFVVLDNRTNHYSAADLAQLAPILSHRKLGVGADGLLSLEEPDRPEVDFTMVYKNADGSDAGMCGNGARCLVLFAFSKGFNRDVTFNVHDTVYRGEMKSENQISINFPVTPEIEILDGLTETSLYKIYTGTEHVVKEIGRDELNDERVLRAEGRKLREHKEFAPNGTNVNFLCGLDSGNLKIRTYEKGVEDLTLACGTGAIASALVWHHLQEHANHTSAYSVHTPGGLLTVNFEFDAAKEKYKNIKLTGPAHFVFDGIYHL